MSEAATNATTLTTPTNESKPPRRRTLQSGFSLMARGEPKIWLTGGMLVICLAMIVSLLTLILVNGLATFWPGPIDWLLLSDQQMDIGEPQRTEVRSDGGRDSQTTLPSRFYRTANFDITNRHYRWFEPEELTDTHIVRPEWALLIERQSWGRMLALPSRLSRPLAGQDPELRKLSNATTWLQELSGELEPLAAEEPALPLTDITTAIADQLQSTRTQQLKLAVTQALKSNSGTVQWQSDEAAPWSSATDAMADQQLVASARLVTDDPAKILVEIQPILDQLARVRTDTEHAMHTISVLDRELSEARIQVRQAELDTGRSVMEKIDGVGPILEALSANELTTSRVNAMLSEVKSLLAKANLAEQLEQLLKRYVDKVLQPARQTFEQELTTWQQQFAEEPAVIRQSISKFTDAWQRTLSRKRPLEDSIAEAEAQTQGYELQVVVPSDAVKLELSAADSQQLLEGKWSTAALELLKTQSIEPVIETADREPSSLATRINKLNNDVVHVEFTDTARGRLSLWGWKSGTDSSSEYVWMMPPQKALNCVEIVRLFPANRLTLGGKLGVYGARWREFLLDNPREANTEGGVFPAIWGTIVMTLIMTLAVVPFGVIAALYLREYTRSGPIVSLVRISINNLAGVPSIVYGVFGLAFFCYSMGAFIDGGAKNAQFGALPSNTWYLTLATTVGVGVIAFLFSLLSSGVNPSQISSFKRRLGRLAPALWLLSLIGAGVLVFKSPFFDGLYEARLPAPTFGKEGLLWASFTLALLTLPVVIVATEEALSAVPNSLREGSLACGASKWQTIYRIVLPHARPGILTGAILAMARGIGEVAPLMLVGALPVAPDLPLDSEFPYFHGSRSFMHLGYQIYWLGFQSQNSEASKPLVFTCTLLLILIVISLNLAAILLRARLRKRFQGNQF